MSKKMKSEEITFRSNEAIRGKPWLDIDRVFNVKEAKESKKNK